MYVHMYICMYVCPYVCPYVCMYVCIHIYIYACVFIYTYIYICMYTCLYTCMYICLYVRNSPKRALPSHGLGWYNTPKPIFEVLQVISEYLLALKPSKMSHLGSKLGGLGLILGVHVGSCWGMHVGCGQEAIFEGPPTRKARTAAYAHPPNRAFK